MDLGGPGSIGGWMDGCMDGKMKKTLELGMDGQRGWTRMDRK